MNKPVLFRVTNNLKIGGIQRRLRALLPLLTEYYEGHIVTYKEKGIFFDELTSQGVHTHFLPRKGHWDPIAIWKLARLFREHNASIVHTHSFGGNIFGILGAALARVPVRIAQVHLSALHWYGKTAFRKKKQILEERFVHKHFSDRILFVSRESLDFFKAQTGLPQKMLTVLHNGITFPCNNINVSKTQLALPDNKKIIGFVGRLTAGKGVQAFLEMAQLATQEMPGAYHFTVIGGGSNLEIWRHRANEMGIADKVTFLGERKDIQNCYPALDLLVFNSEPGVEGMPGVALEACAHGLPILARRTAPIEEIGEYYSRLTFLNETSTISEQITMAMNLPESDPTRLRSEFSIDAMRDRTLHLYEELLMRKGTRSSAT